MLKLDGIEKFNRKEFLSGNSNLDISFKFEDLSKEAEMKVTYAFRDEKSQEKLSMLKKRCIMKDLDNLHQQKNLQCVLKEHFQSENYSVYNEYFRLKA